MAAPARLYASYEDVMVLLAGPRTGKTLCYAIPAILDAPGAVLVTSNKRHRHATREVRAPSHRRRVGLRPPGDRQRGADRLVVDRCPTSPTR